MQSRIHFGLLAIGSVTIAVTITARAGDVHPATSALCREIGRVKNEQAKAHAKAANLPMPKVYEDYLAAVMEGRWADAYERYNAGIRPGAHQYADSTNPVPEQQTAIWQYLLECFGAVEAIQGGESVELWRAYAKAIFDDMPTNSIYFGGTDPGRFIPTAVRDTDGSPDVIILTQNALADNTYMDYARYRWGNRIKLPSSNESQAAFMKYIEDIRSGRAPSNAGVRIESGRVQVTGVEGVMAINGLLARAIFESNRGQHSMFVEESYAIPWMNTYLEPHGPILRLASEPLKEIPRSTVDSSRAFWRQFIGTLQAHPCFEQSLALRSAISKCRTAQAGVYAIRQMTTDAEDAFREAIEIYPYSPEAHSRLADLLVRNGKIAEAIRMMKKFLEPTRSYPFTGAANLGRAHELRQNGDFDGALLIEQGFATNALQNPYVALPAQRRSYADYLTALGKKLATNAASR
ncbi:MAG: tetratricopeptide repeat protein [Kiritimatiellae bacterium]|nr:tetratricopeptide repeat protein [Kiritimatiellia bacterium]